MRIAGRRRRRGTGGIYQPWHRHLNDEHINMFKLDLSAPLSGRKQIIGFNKPVSKTKSNEPDHPPLQNPYSSLLAVKANPSTTRYMPFIFLDSAQPSLPCPLKLPPLDLEPNIHVSAVETKEIATPFPEAFQMTNERKRKLEVGLANLVGIIVYGKSVEDKQGEGMLSKFREQSGCRCFCSSQRFAPHLTAENS